MDQDLTNLYSPVMAPAPLGEAAANPTSENFTPSTKNFWDPNANSQLPVGSGVTSGVAAPITTPDTPISNVSGFLQEEKSEEAYIPPDALGEAEELTNTLMDAKETGGKAGARQARRKDRQADRAARNEEGLTGKDKRDRRRSERSSRKDSWAVYKAGGI
tara:strand:+ start:78 stop:557 length:480 start_codon:yes stop_codon:yes gene_type:complete